METMQRQRQRQLDTRLFPSGGRPGGSERAARRVAAEAVADAADRAMLDALANTDTVMKSMQQQGGQ
jgi:hypothetical protein